MKKVLFTIGLSLFMVAPSYAMYDPAMEMPTSDTPTPMLMNTRAMEVDAPVAVKYDGEVTHNSAGGCMKGKQHGMNATGQKQDCPCKSKKGGHSFMKFGHNAEDFDGPVWLLGLAKLGHTLFCLFVLGLIVFVIRKSWDFAGYKKKK